MCVPAILLGTVDRHVALRTSLRADVRRRLEAERIDELRNPGPRPGVGQPWRRHRKVGTPGSTATTLPGQARSSIRSRGESLPVPADRSGAGREQAACEPPKEKPPRRASAGRPARHG